LVISNSLCLDYWILVQLRLINKILFEEYSQITLLASFKLSIDGLLHKTNHGFAKHFQKILLVVYAAVDIQSAQGM